MKARNLAFTIAEILHLLHNSSARHYHTRRLGRQEVSYSIATLIYTIHFKLYSRSSTL